MTDHDVACERGTRVRLVHHNDRHSPLRPGTEGTVGRTDSFGTIHVQWDDGSSLGIVEEDGDRIEVVRALGDVIAEGRELAPVEGDE